MVTKKASGIVFGYPGDLEVVFGQLGCFYLRGREKVEIKLSQKRKRRLHRLHEEDGTISVRHTPEAMDVETAVKIVRSERAGAQKHAHRRVWH
jgi:hypothetical protein